MVVGPIREIEIGAGRTAPLYLLRFDEQGRLLSPRTTKDLLLRAADATDVFLFSHGWNNTYEVALNRYEEFIGHFTKLRREHDLPVPEPYRPVLIGVIWPSTSWVFPWEDGPVIAASPVGVDEELQEFVASSLDTDAAAELSELVDGAETLDEEQAARIAELLAAGLVDRDAQDRDADDEGLREAPSAADLLEAWRQLEGDTDTTPADPDDFGTATPTTEDVDSPETAGLLGRLNPRTALRMATVWKMKKRAGVVGANGVADVLGDLLERTTARLHLVGHSFGAKVVLSAVAAQPDQARPVRSMLLLQAAVNRWCFADDAAGTGRRGGYRDVLDRVEQPILATRSANDAPLTTVFQLAMRGSHVGEPQIAALGNEERYGALGGFGAAGLGDRGTSVPITDPVDGYDLGGAHEVITVVGDRTISGHGDVSNRSTAWALHALASP